MVVYLDVIFFENIIMNYFLIYITSKLIRIKHNFIYFFLASLIATSYTIVAIIYPINLFRTFILKLILAILIIQVAYRERNKIELLKQIIIFYIVTFIYGGVVLSSFKENHITILISITLVSILITSIWKAFKRKITRESSMCEIIIKIEDKYIRARALIDTGNELEENESGDSVIVINEEILNEEKDLLQIFKINKEAFKKYERRIRMLKYNALGVRDGTLMGIKIDEVIIYYDGYKIENKNAIIALSENKFKNYEAIISLNLIEGGYVCGNTAIIKNESKKAV